MHTAVKEAGRVAAALHGCAYDPALPKRDLHGERAAAEAELERVGEVWPDSARLLRHRLSAALAADAGDDPPLVLAHGDLTPGQLLMSVLGVAVVDVDTLCRAEPALDLGRFLA